MVGVGGDVGMIGGWPSSSGLVAKESLERRDEVDLS